jgi:16S rRNA (cytidine1402-2'-O)-methyltransferase
MTGILFVVATPIGNLEDISLRALRILKDSDYVLCEDTRVTGRLLAYYEIKTALQRYDAHASEAVHSSIIRDLEEGKQIALVSDAGTPGISDPGVFLVSRIRRELPEVTVETIPGPSALTAAFSIAGITGNAFTFLGFVPHKKGRETFFRNLAQFDHPVVFYESVHRIMKTLASLEELYGEQNPVSQRIRVTVARELTKLHEEVVQGTPDEVHKYFTDNPDHVRGEFVVLVDKAG